MIQRTKLFWKCRRLFTSQVPACISQSVEKWKDLLSNAGVQDTEISIKEITKAALAAEPMSVHNAEKLFHQMCRRRAQREPLQHIIGEWDFRYITLHLEKPVFIPRPETEGLIDLINEDMNRGKIVDKFLEVGCGSGAISLSLLNENKDIYGVAIDTLLQAVDLTNKNSRKLNLMHRLKVFHQTAQDFYVKEKFDMLVSNPPYIPSKEMQSLQPEVGIYESHLALDGGSDGLDTVRHVLRKASTWLKPESSIWLEVDTTHPGMIERMVIEEKEFKDIVYLKTHKDYCDRPRFCHLIYAPQ